MSRHKWNVDKVYSNLTDKQLDQQVAKFWDSDIQHEVGKLGKALEEIERRKYG